MNYPQLRKMRDDLLAKNNRNQEENTLLAELKSLDLLLNSQNFSLAASGQNCPACGRPLVK